LTGKQISLLFVCLVSAIVFAALGIWQLERRVWKLDLIMRVESRIHAPARSPPAHDRWPNIAAERDEYRHVRATGYFLKHQTVLVDALTELGAGDWVLTPLKTDDALILVNRGFAPAEIAHTLQPPAGLQTVTGLLRMTEPDGRFLRPNKPREGLWYSRDVGAIAMSRGLAKVAPYFIDADSNGKAGYPVAGLTVVQFRNMHLVYALTWFCLAALSTWGSWLMLRKR
jgi:surfeit locus 1 family protein